MSLLSPGTRVAEFQIEGLIASGGMADVYRVTTEARGLFALKIPKLDELSNTERTSLLKRFEREALALARLKHPGIVAISKINVDPPIPYLAMEYLEGSTALVWGRSVKADLSTWLLVAREICEPLAHAHERNILHRDLKSSNVMVTTNKIPHGRSLLGQVKIIDWGLMKDSGGRLTRSGEAPGTFGAIDPAVLRGQPFSPKSDLYSLGAFLFRALTGQSHLASEYDSNEELLEANRLNLLRHPREIDPAIPKEVEDLLLSLVATDPEDRPASAQHVSAHVRRLARQFNSAAGLLHTPTPSPRTATATVIFGGSRDPMAQSNTKDDPMDNMMALTSSSPVGFISEIVESTGRVFCFQAIDDILLFANPASPFPDEAWKEVTLKMASFLAKYPHLRRAVNFSPTHGPSATQRAEMGPVTDFFRQANWSIALLTNSAFARGSATALSWISTNMKIKGFPCSGYLEALDWLATLGPVRKTDVANRLKELIVYAGHPHNALNS